MGTDKVLFGTLLINKKINLMRKIIFIFWLILMALSAVCQESSPAYKEIKALLQNQGYTIAEEQYANLSQGKVAVHTRTFHEGNSYKIVGMSDDSDVTDVDIFLKDMNGNVYDKDSDTSAFAVILFSPTFTRKMKVEIKNHASNDPRYESRCRIIIGYK
jgi:hypothetical protein